MFICKLNMPDYQYSKIYKIFSKSANLVYYGSTTQTVAMRMTHHRSKYKKWLAGHKRYTSSFLILEHDDWEYELVCKCPCDSRLELHRIEGFYIKNNECVNALVAGRNKKEHYNDNKGEILEKNKIYCEKNKEKIKKTKKIYREKNKEKIKEQNKVYYQKNKEKIKEKVKEYGQTNKEKIKEKIKKKIECECGSSVSKKGLTNHKKTKKHKTILENIKYVKIKIKNKI